MKKGNEKNNKKWRLRRIFKNRMFIFVMTALVFSIIGVSAATYFPSNQVTYDNKTSGLSSTNVQGAIDELYNTCFQTFNPGPGIDVINQLLEKYPDQLYTDEHGNIRYYGANPNNYVNFNNELWRIIGRIEGQLKIVKDESIGDMQWASNYSTNWNNASLKSYLNGEYYNSIEATYKNMIVYHTFYLGGPTSLSDMTSSDWYSAERSSNVYGTNPTSTTQYIGLIYPSDYGYAAGEACKSFSLTDFGRNGCYNIDYIYNEDTEWTQTPNAINKDYIIVRAGYSAMSGASGVISNMYFGSSGVRPTLYLKVNIQITGGNGSKSNPFTIE